MNEIRIELADFYDLLNFSNRNVGSFCHGFVKVVGRFAEEQVSGLVGLPAFYESIISCNRLFQYVVLAFENTSLRQTIIIRLNLIYRIKQLLNKLIMCVSPLWSHLESRPTCLWDRT